MKTKRKQLFWISASVAAIIVCAITMPACSSDDKQDIAAPQSSEYDNLMEDLVAYSSQFSDSHATLSRGDLGWGKFKESVNADHIGYHGGSTVVSISASRQKWKDLKLQELEKKLKEHPEEEQQQDQQKELEKSEPTSISMFDHVIIQNQVDSLTAVYLADMTNVGALHNASILQSILDDDMDFETTEELVQSVVASMNKLGVTLPNFDVQAATHEVDIFFDEIYDDDISVMYNRLSVKYPERKEEFMILNQYLQTTEQLNSVEDIKEFSDGYTKIINQSKISPEVKLELESNITITPASHQLWRTVDAIQQ